MIRPQTSTNSRSLSIVNPFNPYQAYQQMKTPQPLTTTTVTQQQRPTKSQLLFNKSNSHLPAMIRNVENKGLRSQPLFDGFIRRLNLSKQRSVELLLNTRKYVYNFITTPPPHSNIQKTQVDISKMTWQKSKEQLFLEYLVLQESKVKHQGLDEQKEFLNYREKQMRVLQIKSFVQKTKKIRLQNEIDDLLKDTNTKGCKNPKVKYLTNAKSLKQLEKPLLYGVQMESRVKRTQVHSYTPPLPLDFINLGLSQAEKEKILCTIYGRRTYRSNVIIRDNENYRELTQTSGGGIAQFEEQLQQIQPLKPFDEQEEEPIDEFETQKQTFTTFLELITHKVNSQMQDAFLALSSS